MVLSHIKDSEKNWMDLINACNSLEPIRLGNLIAAICIARSRTGPLGKAAVIEIEAYTVGRIPCGIVDDNCEVISDSYGAHQREKEA